ncbi:MAG: hypothetical protein ACRC62_38680 [Microcoleus sp.]
MCAIAHILSIDWRSTSADAAELLNQLKARRKRSKADLADVEVALELLAEANASS